MVVDTGAFSRAQIRQLLQAPLLSEEDARRFSRELLLHHPGLALPPPVELEMQEIRDVEPVPMQTLFRDQSPLGPAHMVRPQFDYAGYLVQPLPVMEQTTLDTPEGLLTIQRQLGAEQQVMETLETYGFTWLLSADGQGLAGYQPADSLTESVGRWKSFLQEGILQLEQMGWIIDSDDSFQMTFHEPQQWWGELGEEDDGWFSMSLEVEIEGKRLPLLPLLGPLLESYEPDELPETLHLPLGDHQYLSVPGEKLRPWLETIIELFDARPPEGDSLKLSMFDAARVADMEDCGPSLISSCPDSWGINKALSACTARPLKKMVIWIGRRGCRGVSPLSCCAAARTRWKRICRKKPKSSAAYHWERSRPCSTSPSV